MIKVLQSDGGKIGIIEMNDAEPYSRYWEIDGNGQIFIEITRWGV